MKISEYAEKVGVIPLTARKWFHQGLIKGAYQMETGTIIIPDDIFETEQPQKETKTVIYARVSSHDQKEDLKRQTQRLINFGITQGYTINKTYEEIASGLNDNRPKLNKILEDETITHIIVEHKDRLTRFGYHYIETLLKRNNVQIIIANETADNKEDLINDFISIITSFCARIYGQRRGKRTTEKITNKLKKELKDNEIS